MTSKKVLVFENSDKKQAEKWTDKDKLDKSGNVNLANFPCPFRALFLGPPNSGKSNMIKNLIIHQRPRFTDIYVVHQDSEGSSEWGDIDPNGILNDVPDQEWFTEITETEEDDPPKKILLIIDDLEMSYGNKTRNHNLSVLFRYISSHKNISVCLTSQNFFSIKPDVRKNANIFFCWKPVARNEIGLIENRVGLEKGVLNQMFKEFRKTQWDSLTFDFSTATPAPIRFNLTEPIEIDEDY
jgi:hypothetical protein